MEMKVISAGGKKVDAVYKGFAIKTDQSKAYGGDETQPEPFDLFLASIGTCAGINVIAFCQNRGIPTDDIELTLTFDRNPDTHMIETIAIDIDLPQDFPEKYLATVKRVVDQCAVKKHMLNPPAFEIAVRS